MEDEGVEGVEEEEEVDAADSLPLRDCSLALTKRQYLVTMAMLTGPKSALNPR